MEISVILAIFALFMCLKVKNQNRLCLLTISRSDQNREFHDRKLLFEGQFSLEHDGVSMRKW